MTPKPKPGHEAPRFELKDQSDETIPLSDFRGRRLLVYFYPCANTPGCTKQACSVRDSLPDLSAAGIAAVGISPDPLGRQKKFDDRHELGFPLLCDEDDAVAEAYGVLAEKSMMGKKYM